MKIHTHNFRTYLFFLFKQVFKKKVFYFVNFVYLLVFVIFIYLIPLIKNSYIASIWTNQTFVPQQILLYLHLAISPLLVTYIFKTSQEDGSELIISSKPISRFKIIFAKFLCFFIIALILSILSATILCFGFLVPESNYHLVISLIISVFFLNLIALMVFGGLLILLSLKLGKVGLIAISVVSAIFFNIINITVVVATRTMDDVANKDVTLDLTSSNVISINNNVKQTKYFSPSSKQFNDTIPFFDLEFQKETFNKALHKSNMQFFNTFNPQKYYQKLSCLGILDEIAFRTNGLEEIGRYHWYSFYYNGPIHSLVENDLVDNNDNYFTNDDNTKWMDFYQQNYSDFVPFITYYQLVGVDALKGMAEINSADQTSPENIANFISSYMNLITNNIYIDTLSYQQNNSIFSNYGAIADNQYLYAYGNKWSKDHSYFPGLFFKAIKETKNIVHVNNLQLEPTKEERDVFNYILFNTLFTNPTINNTSCFLENNKYYKYNFNLTNDGYFLYSHWLYDQLNLNNIKTILNIKNDYDFAYIMYKYKYFLTRQLMGYYGLDDYICTDYSGTNENITIPWNEYFKFVYFPQFNSYKLRNISQYNDNEQAKLIKTLPFCMPRIINNEKETDWLSAYVSNDSVVDRFNVMKYASCIYDGSENPTSQYTSLYQCYDIYNSTSAGKIKLSNTYGYFSELGLKMQTLIHDFATSNDVFPYLSMGYTNAYQSYICKTSNLAYITHNLVFTYDYEKEFNSYWLVLIFVCLGLIILIQGFVLYIRYDVS